MDEVLLKEFPDNIVDRAAALAMRYHCGQINKHDGEPYILHCHRVAVSLREDGQTAPFIATGWLHDTLEDTELTFSDLMILMPNSVAFAVQTLTKNKGESNEGYYYRVRGNDLARRVKIADLTDNFRRNHLISDEETRLRMARKYSLGFDILSSN